MADPLYLVTFPDSRLGRIVTVKVREISDSGLGIMFVRLSGFVLQQDGTIINPEIDALAQRFEETRAFHVNRMSIVSIEEVSDVVVAPLVDMPNVVQFKAPE